MMKRDHVQSSEKQSDEKDFHKTSLSLLDQLRSGRADGWDRFVHLYAPLVYGWCRSGGLKPEESHDVCQDVFAAVARSIERFQQDQAGASFRRWLKTITLNRCRDLRRKRTEQAQGGTKGLDFFAGLPEPPTLADPKTDQVERHFLLSRATEMVRDEFEEKTWKAFWQVVVDCRKPADVAADLGMSAGAVRIAKCRVLAKLRERVPEILDD